MRGSIAASPNGGSFPIQTTLELQGSFTLDKVPADPTTVTLILTPPNSSIRKYIQCSPIDGLDITRVGAGFYVLRSHRPWRACGGEPGRARSQSRRRATSRSVFWVVSQFDCGEGEATGCLL